MVYIAKEAWPEKKDFLKENINKRLHINRVGQATVYPALSKQTKSFLNKNTHARTHATHLASSTIL